MSTRRWRGGCSSARFARNPDGVVLVSMFREASLAQNLAVVAAPPPDDAGLLDRLTPQVGGG